MRNRTFSKSVLALELTLFFATWVLDSACAEQHRATRLGNPATRFAPPLASPDDLRARFSDPKLKPDIALILRQWGWQGNLDDLFRAAMTAPVTDIKIPIGARMPFMSSRESGRPVTLRDVVWVGDQPVPAYAFEFSSKGRRYRCLTPKPCSNFFLEDLGAPILALACNAPAQVPVGRPLKACLTLSNQGDAPEPKVAITWLLPVGATNVLTVPAATESANTLTWEVHDLGTKNSTQFCASFLIPEPANLSLIATAEGSLAKSVQARCEAQVFGTPGLLIDAVDLEDPVEVGHNVIYDIKVTNQGTAPCTNLRLVCTLPESEEFVSATGPSPVAAQGKTLTTDPIGSFVPKTVVTWRVIVKALAPDDARFKVNLYADELKQPILEEEPTHLY